MTNPVRVVVAAALCLTAAASWAEAQGNGHGNAYGKRNQGASGGAAAASASAPSGSLSPTEAAQGPPAGVGVRNFGAWLDDASVMAPGSGSDAVVAKNAAKGRVVLAPAMNTNMWEDPATQANVKTLRERGHEIIEPDAGLLAVALSAPAG